MKKIKIARRKPKLFKGTQKEIITPIKGYFFRFEFTECYMDKVLKVQELQSIPYS